MTQEEYKSKFDEINNDFQLKLKSLAKEYAISNNPYKIGDVVTDHMGSIKIEQIQFTLGGGKYLPECAYTGIELTKKGEPNKRGTKRRIYLSNLLQP
jgi:hypothetical protein